MVSNFPSPLYLNFNNAGMSKGDASHSIRKEESEKIFSNPPLTEKNKVIRGMRNETTCSGKKKKQFESLEDVGLYIVIYILVYCYRNVYLPPGEKCIT